MFSKQVLTGDSLSLSVALSSAEVTLLAIWQAFIIQCDPSGTHTAACDVDMSHTGSVVQLQI